MKSNSWFPGTPTSYPTPFITSTDAWPSVTVALTGSDMFGYFVAAASISLYAEIMARVRKFPAFSYLVTALLPLVPGGGVYYTVEYLLQGNRELSFAQAVRTASIAGPLAVGLLVVSSLFRMAGVAKQQRRTEKS